MNTIKELQKAISESESIIIFSHVNPDGDTLSSNLALKYIISKVFNKKSDSVFIGKFPNIYKFLPLADEIKSIDEIDKNKQYDLAIAVDVAAKDRMLDGLNIFQNAKITVNIDHHKTNNNYACLNYVKPEACSAGQVIYDLLEESKTALSKDLATLLYVSIMTDTGGFKYENTSVRTLNTAAELVNFGAEPCKLYRACYESKPQAMVQLQAFVLSNAAFSKQGKVAYAIITKDLMRKFNASDDYTDGISEALRQIRTVEISMVLKENDNGYTKVSMRSKSVDITKVVSVFGGGGHKFAAGCTIKKNPVVAIEKLLEKVNEIL